MRALLLSTALILAAIPAAPVLAQQAPAGAASGLRYLSWPGKPAVTTAGPAQVPSQAAAGLRPALPTQDQPAAAPTPSYSYTPAPPRMASTGLTPASNWLSPPPAAAASSQPYAYAPPPPAYVPPAPQPSPQPNPILNPASAPPAATPTARLVQPAPVAAQPTARLVEPAPVLQQQATQQPVEPQQAADPMAPRRDAPIFRMGAQSQPQPQPQAPIDGAQTYQTAQIAPAGQVAPAAGSARYYSVHRPLGRTPDPAPQPQPVYLDALPIELISPPQSADLAEPQAGPALIRNQNGSVRAAVAQSEGDHQ
ncbi:hypothetical protein ASG17_13920 [Brevundimonas sp. Leaf363]|uniref:hypothetical protein n=1 Tax=Brevundimonas sp. Leaf363 TaxID=1736353 RepID=UPI0006F4529C|nr:hypothetical protein [Brevundimonas sp. Leaf363]KQS54037.1 hypothetical protein ASG17_13920 [Brevundimonas sp. Leaf363]